MGRNVCMYRIEAYNYVCEMINMHTFTVYFILKFSQQIKIHIAMYVYIQNICICIGNCMYTYATQVARHSIIQC